MNVNANDAELLLRMAQMAVQFSQNSLPQVGNSTSGTGEKSQFQTMLEDKKTQAESTRPEQKPADSTASQEAPVQKPVEDGGQTEAAPSTDGQNDRVLAELAAALTAPAVPVQVPVVIQEPEAAEPQAEVLALTAEILPAAEQQPQGVETAAPVAHEAPAQQAVPLQEAQPELVQTQTQTQQVQPQSQENVQQPQTVQPQAQAQQEVQPVVEEQTQVRAEAPDVQTSGKQSQDTPDAVTVQDNSAGQPLFREVETAPVKVGNAPTLDTTSDQFDANLSRTLMGALEQGQQKVALRLSPEHLGNLTVELTRSDAGVLQVVLRAENEQTAHLLREHASTLGMLLQSSGQGEVRVEVPQARESERPWQQPDQQNGQQERGQSRHQEQQPRREETEDFLHQLRLGLYQADLV